MPFSYAATNPDAQASINVLTRRFVDAWEGTGVRALISADMEGATGVTCPDDCRPGSAQWERFRRLLTADVNAVATGLFEGGVDEVLVNEAHASMRNILLENLDPRLQMLTGRHKGLGMMEGVQQRPDMVAFVGYHSAPGTTGVLSHTFLGSEITRATLSGRTMSEGYLNALLAAEYGVRVGLVSGDDVTCEDARDYAPRARGVVVKKAVDRYSAICRTPEQTAAALQSAAQACVGDAAVPALPAAPYVCEVEFLGTSSAAVAALVPTVERTGPRCVRFESETIHGIYECFIVVSRLGADAAEALYG
jgi:D-amino peptidase